MTPFDPESGYRLYLDNIRTGVVELPAPGRPIQPVDGIEGAARFRSLADTAERLLRLGVPAAEVEKLVRCVNAATCEPCLSADELETVLDYAAVAAKGRAA